MSAASVWKFSVPRPDNSGRAFVPDVPERARFLSVGLQDDAMVAWASIPESYGGSGTRRLIVLNTGAVAPDFPDDGARFLGTVETSNGVEWHVWDGDVETTA